VQLLKNCCFVACFLVTCFLPSSKLDLVQSLDLHLISLFKMRGLLWCYIASLLIICHGYTNPNMANLFTLVGPCNTYDLDSMLGEAINMVTNAQTQIGALTSGAILPFTTKARIANNAQNMFNTNTQWKRVLDSPSRAKLDQVTGFSPSRHFLFT